MSDTARSRAILATASRLFAEKGFGNATTSEIARTAKVAEGTIYHHFGSKDRIFLTLFDETIGGYLAGIEELLSRGRTGRETLSALTRFQFDYVARCSEQYLILLRDLPAGLTAGSPAEKSLREEKLNRVTELFCRVLSRGKADGTLCLPDPVRDTAEVLRSSFYGAIRLKMTGVIRVPLPRLARMLESYWLKALSPRLGRSRAGRKAGG